MNAEHITWVIGSGGLLGRSLSRLVPERHRFDHEPIEWSSPEAPASMAKEARRFVERCDSDSGIVIWCAGAGIIGTSRADLEHETAILAALLDNLRDGQIRSLFLTSSAGGVYGGSTDIPITERSSPAPLSDYGVNKLAQESLLADWAGRTGTRAVIGRVANLYGPGQRLSKPQGLISQICFATLTRRPVSVYVSLDTLRDYIYVDDCSRLILKCLERAEEEPPGTITTRILASESSISIGGLLAQAKRVLGRNPNVVMVPSSMSTQQGSTLSFRSVVWPELNGFTMTPLPVGIEQTSAYLRRQQQIGSLG